MTEQGEHAGHPFPLVPERHSTGKRSCQLMPCILLMAAPMERVESACLSRSRGPGYTAVHECVEYTSPVFCNLGVWSYRVPRWAIATVAALPMRCSALHHGIA